MQRTILDLTLPPNAIVGSTVDIDAGVINKFFFSDRIWVRVEGTYNGRHLNFTPSKEHVGVTRKHFYSSFTMPNTNAAVNVTVFWSTDGVTDWQADDQSTVAVVLGTTPPREKTEIIEVQSITKAPSGYVVPIKVKVRNTHTASLNVMVDGYTNLGHKIEFHTGLGNEFVKIAAGGASTLSGSLVMPSSNIKITVRSKHYENGNWNNIGDEESWDIQLDTEPLFPKTNWITIAEGETSEELEASAAGKYIHGNSRTVITFSRWVPSWVLSSGAWLYNRVSNVLASAGIETRDVKVVGKEVHLYTYNNPHLALIVVLAVVGVLSALGIIRFVTQLKIQQEITEQLRINLETIKTKQEAQQALFDHNQWLVDNGYDPLPTETTETILKAMWESGYNPKIFDDDSDGINWEKYLKYGLIGIGVIAGTAILLPVLIDATRSKK